MRVLNEKVLERSIFSEYMDDYLDLVDELAERLGGDVASDYSVTLALKLDDVSELNNVVFVVYADMYKYNNGECRFYPKVEIKGLPSEFSDEDCQYGVSSVLRRIYERSEDIEKRIKGLNGVILQKNKY